MKNMKTQFSLVNAKLELDCGDACLGPAWPRVGLFSGVGGETLPAG